MLKSLSKALASVALVAFASSAFAEKGEQWLTDMDEAQKVAKAEGKSIFMFFTGSDWCGWCIKLDNEVLSKEEFLAYAKDNLVLVDLDFPQGEDVITEEQRAHNDKWKDVFKPRGFPTVYLTDASAKAFAQTGYQAGGPVAYVDHLKALIEGKKATEQLQADIAKAKGLKRAKLLDQLLNTDGAMIDDKNGKIEEIVALTEGKDDTLYNKYHTIQVGNNMMSDLGKVYRGEGSNEEKLDQILAVFSSYDSVKEGQALHRLLGSIGDQFIKTGQTENGAAFMDKITSDSSYPLEIQQTTALFKAIITANASEVDHEKAIKFYDQAMAMDPESQTGKRAKMMKEKLAEKASAQS
ncbi:thioredoxin family protein [Porticoccaceae bacterium LTM1]|nr:thioredoxin family protein [Porticoccaceae bacterium LTM1]